MATNETNTRRPKSKAKGATVSKPVEWVLVRLSVEADKQLEELRAKRTLNNRIASRPTILAEAIKEALVKETELMRENISVIQKRVGGSTNKITS